MKVLAAYKGYKGRIWLFPVHDYSSLGLKAGDEVDDRNLLPMLKKIAKEFKL